MFNRYFARYYKYLIAVFFALHYGLFHWGYFVFIVDSGRLVLSFFKSRSLGLLRDLLCKPSVLVPLLPSL